MSKITVVEKEDGLVEITHSFIVNTFNHEEIISIMVYVMGFFSLYILYREPKDAEEYDLRKHNATKVIIMFFGTFVFLQMLFVTYSSIDMIFSITPWDAWHEKPDSYPVQIYFVLWTASLWLILYFRDYISNKVSWMFASSKKDQFRFTVKYLYPFGITFIIFTLPFIYEYIYYPERYN